MYEYLYAMFNLHMVVLLNCLWTNTFTNIFIYKNELLQFFLFSENLS